MQLLHKQNFIWLKSQISEKVKLDNFEISFQVLTIFFLIKINFIIIILTYIHIGVRDNNAHWDDSGDEMGDDIERKENKANFKYENQIDKKVISGSSLFGAKAAPQKNKTKMKNMRKKLALD